MIRSDDDLEAQLARLERRYERGADGTFLLPLGAGMPIVALRLVPPLLVVQVVIGPVPGADAQRLPLFKKLLELNASELVHTAYGLEDDTIVLSSALVLDTLDLNELEAVLADVDIALAEQVPMLRALTAPAS